MATTHGDETRRKPGTVGVKLPTRGQVEEEGGFLEKGAAQELTLLARVLKHPGWGAGRNIPEQGSGHVSGCCSAARIELGWCLLGGSIPPELSTSSLEKRFH